jgi:serine/threonine protein kinase
MPGNEVWGMEKIRRPVLIGQGSFGTVHALSGNKVYKTMVIENPENYMKAFAEVSANGCIGSVSNEFAIADECYYFTQRSSASTKITIWMRMDRYKMDLKKLIQNKFNDLDSNINLNTWKHELMSRLAKQLITLQGSLYVDSYDQNNSVEGLQHRDIKSENVFLDNDMNPYLGDFGFVSFGKTSSDQLGTPEYGAPEMFSFDFRAPYTNDLDTFSLGVVFYEIINSNPSRDIYASDHFSMQLGHQKPFSQSDFPGYEWMIGMVQAKPKDRMTMYDVYLNLENSIVGKNSNQVHQIEFKEPVKNQAQMMNYERPLNHPVRQKKSLWDFREDQNVPSQFEMKQKNISKPVYDEKQMNKAYDFKVDQVASKQQLKDQINFKMNQMQMNKQMDFGVVKPYHNQAVKPHHNQAVKPQMIQDYKPREFVKEQYPFKQEYLKLIQQKRNSIIEKAQAPKINGDQNYGKQNRSQSKGEKVLQNREKFRKRIFESQIQFRRVLI